MRRVVVGEWIDLPDIYFRWIQEFAPESPVLAYEPGMMYIILPEDMIIALPMCAQTWDKLIHEDLGHDFDRRQIIPDE